MFIMGEGELVLDELVRDLDVRVIVLVMENCLVWESLGYHIVGLLLTGNCVVEVGRIDRCWNAHHGEQLFRIVRGRAHH
jgi:hypothetical protein